jgi:hypothetical protein
MQPGRGFDHPPTSIAEVKERAELYLYLPLCLHGRSQDKKKTENKGVKRGEKKQTFFKRGINFTL